MQMQACGPATKLVPYDGLRKICFVVDGGRRLGMGHVQQAITFAGVLAGQASLSFLTKSDEPVLAKIREHGFPVTQMTDDAAILQYLSAQTPDIIIFDKLDVAEELARDIRQELQSRLVIFTNLTNANRYADVAVTADIGSRFENIRIVDDETRTLYLYGPKYWILRPEFFTYCQLKKPRPHVVKRLLLIFGGSDPANLTSASLEQLLRLDRRFRLEIVLGAHFAHDDDIRQVLEQHKDRGAEIAVHRNISNVAELMHSADLVLASPGLSAFEALCVGTPVIVVPHDELQRDTYLGFMRMLEREELWRLGAMIEAKDFTWPDDEHIQRMEIGQGIEELKEAIMMPSEGSQQ